MGFLRGLFGKRITKVSKPISEDQNEQHSEKVFLPESDWVDVPAFLPADPEEYELVSIIATSIATGDRPEAQFLVKNIKKRNPEAHLVSVITASIAAGAMPESNLVITKISKTNN